MSTTDEKMFVVSLTGEQIRLLSEAANLVSRLYVGQLEDLTRVLKNASKAEGIREKVEELTTLAFPDKATKESSETSRILFDIHQVFRNVLAWEEKPRGGISPDYDDPLPMSNRPLPKVTPRDYLLRLIDESAKNTKSLFVFSVGADRSKGDI